MSVLRYIIGGAVCGLAAAWVKSKVEPPLEEVGNKIFCPDEEALRLKGADVTGHMENMPPAVLIDKISSCADIRLSEETKEKLFPVVHYGVGAATGAVYALTARKMGWIGKGAGIPAGMIIWGLSHGSSVPILGLQAPVKEMPKSWWVWEFGSHIIFGMALEFSRRILFEGLIADAEEECD